MRSLFLILFACILLSGCVSQQRNSQVTDLGGTLFDPLAGGSVTVLVFISDDCPISNRYVPELNRLHESFAKRGVNFWLVHADPTESMADIREHAKQFDLKVPELRDPNHYLMTQAEAKVTPTAAVFSREGKLVYHGCIDDRVSDLGGREHLEPTRRDLAAAVDEVLAGKPVSVPETKAVGCFIPNLH